MRVRLASALQDAATSRVAWPDALRALTEAAGVAGAAVSISNKYTGNVEEACFFRPERNSNPIISGTTLRSTHTRRCSMEAGKNSPSGSRIRYCAVANGTTILYFDPIGASCLFSFHLHGWLRLRSSEAGATIHAAMRNLADGALFDCDAERPEGRAIVADTAHATTCSIALAPTTSSIFGEFFSAPSLTGCRRRARSRDDERGMDSTSVAAAACAILGREAAAERLVALTVAHLELANEGEGAVADSSTKSLACGW
jgi:hypothetical protein